MRVDKNKLIAGFTTFIETEVIAKMTDDKAAQVVLSVAVKAIRVNPAIADKILGNGIVRMVLGYEDQDGKESYDIDSMASMISESISKYGYFPVVLPAVPFISPREKELKFGPADVDRLKRYIKEA